MGTSAPSGGSDEPGEPRPREPSRLAEDLTLSDDPGAGPPAPRAKIPSLRVTEAPGEAWPEARPPVSLPRAEDLETLRIDLEVRVPAPLLVVAEDRRTGARLAGRLLVHGYTCRVAAPHLAEAAIAEERFELALVDIPTEGALADGGASILAKLERFSGPVLLASPAAIDLARLAPRPSVKAAVVKPFLDEEIVPLIESTRRATRPGPRPRAATAPRAGAPFELSANVVRALVTVGDGRTFRGRVRAMSHAGEMWIEARQALGVGPVLVDLALVGGAKNTISGQALPGSDGEIRVRLEPDETQRGFVQRFVDEARDITQPSIEQVIVRQEPRGEADLLDDTELMARWDEARQYLDDDAIQQRFIQDCLKAQRVDFAVRSYRELKEASDDERAARYLQQVGTILGFYALKREKPDVQDAKLPTGIKVALGAFVAGVVILWVVLQILR